MTTNTKNLNFVSDNNVTLEKRGPFFFESDVCLDVTPDELIDIGHGGYANTIHFVMELLELNIGIRIIEVVGEGGGNPFVEFHGEQEALEELQTRIFETHQEDLLELKKY
jgi:hypothetical protein